MSAAPDFISSFGEKYAAHFVIIPYWSTVTCDGSHAVILRGVNLKLNQAAFASCGYGRQARIRVTTAWGVASLSLNRRLTLSI